MSTAQPNDGQGVVTITREQRDALHYEIRTYELETAGPLTDFGHCLEWDKGYEARRYGRRVSRAIRLLEDLGWDRDGIQDVYALTMDAATLREWARWRLSETEQTIAGDAEAFAAVRAGRNPWSRSGEMDAEAEAAMAAVREITDRNLEVVDACRAILEQLEAA